MIDERKISDYNPSINEPGLVPIKESVDSFLKAVELRKGQFRTMPGLETGFSDLDALTNGLQKSRLFVVAARPVMGKSLFCYCIAQHVAVEGNQGVAFFSPTESTAVVARRMVERVLGFAINQLRRRAGSGADETLESAANVLRQAPLYFDESTLISTRQIRSRCLNLNQSGKTLSLIIIDDISRVTHASQPGDRLEEVHRICADLKMLAKELDLPIIVVSGVSRNVDNKKNKKPLLGDIQYCEAIEQAADVVMFIYRDEYYHSDSENRGQAEVVIAKNRMGRSGSIMLWFDETTGFGNELRFRDRALGHMGSLF